MFVTGENDLIAKQIFWAVIRSHDIMARYKDSSFKNDRSVSSEYVKFLVMNTGKELVDQLVKKNAVLEEKVGHITKELQAATTASSTASNNVNTLTRTVDALVKRVSALESRK
jgi:FMN-dependent NADH-azoreductase